MPLDYICQSCCFGEVALSAKAQRTRAVTADMSSDDALLLPPAYDDETTPLRNGRRRKSRELKTLSGMRFRSLVDNDRSTASAGYQRLGGSLVSCEWYHGDITRDESIARLTARGMMDGLFLVRKRGTEHVLCVCGNDRVSNFLIKNKTGGYSIGQDAPLFYSLQDLIAYFRDYQGGLPSVLIQECPATASAASSSTRAAIEDYSASEFKSYDATSRKKQNYSPEERKKRKIALRRRREQQLQEQLASLPAYTPYWSRGTAALMAIIMVVEIARGGVSKVAFQAKPTTSSLAKNISSQLQTLTYEPSYNLMIGPSTQFLIEFGAKFGTCMREDNRYLLTEARSRQANEYLQLGCCTSTISGSCGASTASDCASSGGTYAAGPCTDTLCPIPTVRPCCHYSGKCEVTTENYCKLAGGVWSTSSRTCGDAECLASICGGDITDNKADQWYRFIIPIFMHSGILHYGVNIYLQLGLGSQIERTTGTLRMALIYMISGIGGYLTSAVFSPNIPSVGASGCIFGLIGVAVVDLFQSWQVVEAPVSRAVNTVLHTAGYLMIGTLPFIDNWAHVGGFVFGVLSSIIFLPYLTFGILDSLRKRCMMCVTIPILVSSFFIGFLIFYVVQETQSFCPGCKYVQCVPYTDNFCRNVPGWSDDDAQ